MTTIWKEYKMTAISIRILKVDENSEWVKYAFGGPPQKVLGHVKIFKANGEIRLVDIIDDKYMRHIFPGVEKQLTEHYQQGEFPERTLYAS
jgi:hypothetical protein